MRIKTNYFIRYDKLFIAIAIAVMLAACGKGGVAGNGYVSTTLNQTGTGTGTLTTVPTTIGNSTSLTVDMGPLPGTAPSINVAYVTVTICPPGTSGSTTTCQKIDHVSLDTGSSGLRLLNSVLSSNLNLPAETYNGQAIGECLPFVVGTTWGSVRYADIYVGGEVARNVPIQDIGDNPGGATPPATCTSYGTLQDTQALLGSNGILGVSSFISDSGLYFSCASSGCNSINAMASQVPVVSNPVYSFAADNNGTVISLPTISPSGSTGLSGKLIFGIGTQSTSISTNTVNNNIPAGTNIYPENNLGNFTTSFSTNYTSSYFSGSQTTSYLDSGSNGLFFYDSDIPQDSLGWYDPAGSVTINATNTNSANSQVPISFLLVNADPFVLSTTLIVAANIGGTGTNFTFAWGLPFFYGRTVFTGIEGSSVTTQSGILATGPFWAY